MGIFCKILGVVGYWAHVSLYPCCGVDGWTGQTDGCKNCISFPSERNPKIEKFNFNPTVNMIVFNNRVHTGKIVKNSRTSKDFPTVFKD